MSLGQVNSGFNLLGQGGAATAARMAPVPEAPPAPESALVEPKLAIAWGDFRQSLWSSLRGAMAWPLSAKDLLGADYFKECWIERRMPWRAVAAAALWHVAFLVSPFSLFNTALPHNSAFDNTQLTWSGPIQDFPALEIPAARPKPAPRTAAAAKPHASEGADAFHPHQRIITDPVHPNHPRQTLINPVAPQLAPKILPNLPNIVQLQAAAAPARPHIEISARDLAKLHPREHRVATVKATPPTDVPALEQKPADIALAISPDAPARPKLDLNAGAAPRAAERRQTGDSVSAPEIGAAQTAAANGSPATLVALSAEPAPPKPDMQPPAGNLAARMSISPEGKKSGVAGGAPNDSATAGGGKSPVGIIISGGNPKPSAEISGIGGSHLKLLLPSSRGLLARPDSDGKFDDPPTRTGPPDFSLLPPGAKAEQVFADKRVYTLNVQMANLNSASGSWILHFSQLDSGSNSIGDVPRISASTDLSGLSPIHKVDPKYPPELIEQNVEGEVILYAVIRADGSVGNIQIVRSVDPQLDANAKSAFSQWKFRPATKDGVPVALEAIVHVPFHLPDNR